MFEQTNYNDYQDQDNVVIGIDVDVRNQDALHRLNNSLYQTHSVVNNLSHGVIRLASGISGMLDFPNKLMDKLKKPFEEVGNTITRIGSVMFQLNTASRAAMYGVGLLTARLQVMQRSLTLVGQQAGHTKKELLETVEAVKKQGITTQQAQQAVLGFVRANLNLAKASQFARAAQNLAVIAGEDSSQTLGTLIYAISSYNTMILRQYGLTKTLTQVMREYAKAHHIAVSQLTERQQKEAMMNYILKEGAKANKVYEEAMHLVGKRMTSMARYIETIHEKMGNAIKSQFNIIESMKIEYTKFLSELPQATYNVAYGIPKILSNIGFTLGGVGLIVFGQLVKVLSYGLGMMGAAASFGLWNAVFRMKDLPMFIKSIGSVLKDAIKHASSIEGVSFFDKLTIGALSFFNSIRYATAGLRRFNKEKESLKSLQPYVGESVINYLATMGLPLSANAITGSIGAFVGKFKTGIPIKHMTKGIEELYASTSLVGEAFAPFLLAGTSAIDLIKDLLTKNKEGKSIGLGDILSLFKERMTVPLSQIGEAMVSSTYYNFLVNTEFGKLLFKGIPAALGGFALSIIHVLRAASNKLIMDISSYIPFASTILPLFTANTAMKARVMREGRESFLSIPVGGFLPLDYIFNFGYMREALETSGLRGLFTFKIFNRENLDRYRALLIQRELRRRGLSEGESLDYLFSIGLGANVIMDMLGSKVTPYFRQFNKFFDVNVENFLLGLGKAAGLETEDLSELIKLLPDDIRLLMKQTNVRRYLRETIGAYLNKQDTSRLSRFISGIKESYTKGESVYSTISNASLVTLMIKDTLSNITGVVDKFKGFVLNLSKSVKGLGKSFGALGFTITALITVLTSLYKSAQSILQYGKRQEIISIEKSNLFSQYRSLFPYRNQWLFTNRTFEEVPEFLPTRYMIMTANMDQYNQLKNAYYRYIDALRKGHAKLSKYDIERYFANRNKYLQMIVPGLNLPVNMYIGGSIWDTIRHYGTNLLRGFGVFPAIAYDWRYHFARPLIGMTMLHTNPYAIGNRQEYLKYMLSGASERDIYELIRRNQIRPQEITNEMLYTISDVRLRRLAIEAAYKNIAKEVNKIKHRISGINYTLENIPKYKIITIGRHTTYTPLSQEEIEKSKQIYKERLKEQQQVLKEYLNLQKKYNKMLHSSVFALDRFQKALVILETGITYRQQMQTNIQQLSFISSLGVLPQENMVRGGLGAIGLYSAEADITSLIVNKLTENASDEEIIKELRRNNPNYSNIPDEQLIKIIRYVKAKVKSSSLSKELEGLEKGTKEYKQKLGEIQEAEQLASKYSKTLFTLLPSLQGIGEENIKEIYENIKNRKYVGQQQLELYDLYNRLKKQQVAFDILGIQNRYTEQQLGRVEGTTNLQNIITQQSMIRDIMNKLKGQYYNISDVEQNAKIRSEFLKYIQQLNMLSQQESKAKLNRFLAFPSIEYALGYLTQQQLQQQTIYRGLLSSAMGLRAVGPIVGYKLGAGLSPIKITQADVLSYEERLQVMAQQIPKLLSNVYQNIFNKLKEDVDSGKISGRNFYNKLAESFIKSAEEYKNKIVNNFEKQIKEIQNKIDKSQSSYEKERLTKEKQALLKRERAFIQMMEGSTKNIINTINKQGNKAKQVLNKFLDRFFEDLLYRLQQVTDRVTLLKKRLSGNYSIYDEMAYGYSNLLYRQQREMEQMQERYKKGEVTYGAIDILNKIHSKEKEEYQLQWTLKAKNIIKDYFSELNSLYNKDYINYKTNLDKKIEALKQAGLSEVQITEYTEARKVALTNSLIGRLNQLIANRYGDKTHMLALQYINYKQQVENERERIQYLLEHNLINPTIGRRYLLELQSAVPNYLRRLVENASSRGQFTEAQARQLIAVYQNPQYVQSMKPASPFTLSRLRFVIRRNLGTTEAKRRYPGLFGVKITESEILKAASDYATQLSISPEKLEQMQKKAQLDISKKMNEALQKGVEHFKEMNKNIKIWKDRMKDLGDVVNNTVKAFKDLNRVLGTITNKDYSTNTNSISNQTAKETTLNNENTDYYASTNEGLFNPADTISSAAEEASSYVTPVKISSGYFNEHGYITSYSAPVYNTPDYRAPQYGDIHFYNK